MTKVRQVVGTRKGMNSWAGQGLTAILMILVFVYLAVAFAILAPSGHAELVSFMAADYIRVPATIAVFAVVWHAWLGAKSVVMDYIKWPWFRVVKYVGTIIYLLACTVWFSGLVWSL